MTTYQRNRGQFSVPEPEYDDLEVRCTWSGEYEEVSNIRISLEVKCVPNTQLQLLNIRGPGIFLEDSFLEPLRQTEYDSDYQETDTPQSPLFGFSPLVRDGNRDTGLSPQDDSMFDDIRIPRTRPVLEESKRTFAAGENVQQDSKVQDTELAAGGSVFSVSPVRPSSSAPGSEFSGVNKSRKRSATDADLPDSGSDVDNERDGVLRDVTNRKARQLNSVGSTGIEDRSKQRTTSDLINHRDIACPRSPKKSSPTKIPGLINRNENTRPRSPDKVAGTGTSTTERLRVPGQSVPKGKQAQKSTLIPKSTSTGHCHPETPASTSSAETVVGFSPTDSVAPVIPAVITDNTYIKSIRETRVRFQMPGDTTAGLGDFDDQPLSPVPSRTLEADLEQRSKGSSGINGETELCYAPGKLEESGHQLDCTVVDKPEPSDQPEVEIIDGLVILKNSERVHPTIFKVTITAALFVIFPNNKGWSDLEIPGIPRTGAGKIGVLLFLMPADHGLEIRTTNVNRATIVENCLIAEFVNTGNLILPLRRCDREFCGKICDFTVDQEIVSHSIAKTGPGQPVIRMNCHALCSVRLYNRCFWSEKCIIRLYVDGGPSGFFKCDVTPQKHAVKKIFFKVRENTPMGVSHIRVTCSPKDLDRLFVSWALEFPGQRAAYWVPRIYSASSRSHDRIQECQRYALLEMLNDPSYHCSGIEATELEYESDSEYYSDSEFTQNYEHTETVPEYVSENPKRASKWPIISQIERAVQMQLRRHNQCPRYFLRQALIGVVFLIFLLFSPVMSTVSGRDFGQFVSLLNQAPSQVPEQISQISWFHLPRNLFKDIQENFERQESSTTGLEALNMINGARTTDVEEEGEKKLSVGDEGEQNMQSMKMQVGINEHEESPVSFRDRIDYWLGWTGPI
ncbi:hypothetical protein BDW62DRAFT_29671 [Aspergillus aurantiobrunneus]